ncbi:MAG: response regulator [bacterium]|nr:response regulator [bacterium]
MSGRGPTPQPDNKGQITIILVDDIPETRENIKKLLAFEPDFKVIGVAGTGREGVELAKEYQPDIIIMDINMPDMDGLQATSHIKKSVPASAVIIMSVQNDPDYMRRAMLAGARDFLTKPINMDELYNTIRTVYKSTEEQRRLAAAMQSTPSMLAPVASVGEGEHAGHIIAVYSPQGGAGTTMLATNLAAGLMKEGIKVLLVDADLQFGDIDVFLALQAQQTIVEVAQDVDDLDIELFENIVVTHDSGLKVLMGPQRPELADEIMSKPNTVGLILEKVAPNYDFVIVDTSKAFNEVLLGILDRATKIILMGTPTLSSVKNIRFVLDLFDQLGYDPNKSMLVLNKVWEDSKEKGATISAERIQGFLKRPVVARLPHIDERIILSAVNKGVPVIASDRDTRKPLIKQLVELSDLVYKELMGKPEDQMAEEPGKGGKKPAARPSGIFGRVKQ